MSASSTGRGSDDLWVPIAMGALFFVWLVLFATGVTTSAVEALRPFLPSWFPLLDLALVPVLAFLAAASLPIPPKVRVVCAAVALCAMSAMYLAYRVHPIAYIAILAVFLLEAFFIVPRWNTHRRRRLGLRPLPFGAHPQKSGARDYLVYVVVGLAIATCLVYVVLSRQ